MVFLHFFSFFFFLFGFFLFLFLSVFLSFFLTFFFFVFASFLPSFFFLFFSTCPDWRSVMTLFLSLFCFLFYYHSFWINSYIIGFVYLSPYTWRCTHFFGVFCFCWENYICRMRLSIDVTENLFKLWIINKSFNKGIGDSETLYYKYCTASSLGLGQSHQWCTHLFWLLF